MPVPNASRNLSDWFFAALLSVAALCVGYFLGGLITAGLTPLLDWLFAGPQVANQIIAFVLLFWPLSAVLALLLLLPFSRVRENRLLLGRAITICSMSSPTLLLTLALASKGLVVVPYFYVVWLALLWPLGVALLWGLLSTLEIVHHD